MIKFVLTASLLFIPALGISQGAGESGGGSGGDSEEKVEFQTEMDFDASMIDGKMKAPSGFFLQGRNKQSLQSMVQLRTGFREELRNSRSAVKAMVR